MHSVSNARRASHSLLRRGCSGRQFVNPCDSRACAARPVVEAQSTNRGSGAGPRWQGRADGATPFRTFRTPRGAHLQRGCRVHRQTTSACATRHAPPPTLDTQGAADPASRAKRKIVLADVMDTLVRDPFFTDVPAYFNMTLGELYEAKHPDTWAAFERGEISEEDLERAFFLDGRSWDVEGLKAVMKKGYRWVEGAEDLLAALAEANVEVHALSNYPVWHTLIRDALGPSATRLIRWSFMSCDLGVRKPSREIYERAATSVLQLDQGRPVHGEELEAECRARLVFVDDRAVNCEAAEALGIPSVHFTGSSSDLARRLHALGVPGLDALV